MRHPSPPGTSSVSFIFICVVVFARFFFLFCPSSFCSISQCFLICFLCFCWSWCVCVLLVLLSFCLRPADNFTLLVFVFSPVSPRPAKLRTSTTQQLPSVLSKRAADGFPIDSLWSKRTGPACFGVPFCKSEPGSFGTCHVCTAGSLSISHPGKSTLAHFTHLQKDTL